MIIDPNVKKRGPFYQWSDDPRLKSRMEKLAKESKFLRDFGLKPAESPVKQCTGSVR